MHLDDTEVRLATFEWLATLVARQGDVLSLDALARGFEFRGERVRLATRAKGIFKPRVLREMPLSIRTSPGGGYDDGFDPAQDTIVYRYRGSDPMHSDNVGLRRAMARGVPLVYLYGIVPNRYLPVWPVFVVGDDPARLTFHLAVDDARAIDLERATRGIDIVHDADDAARRRYVTATVRTRLHQQSFRERVLHAYRSQCAMCRLRHDELLDASHIVPDGEPAGDPVVDNGLALCKLHHAAFDRYFVGVRPDFVLEVRREILDEDDGPMLQHGLKGLHGRRLILPRRIADRPDPGRLAWRWARFRDAVG